MAQYLDKSALVAEIERRIKNLYPKGGQGRVVTKILKDHYEDLLSFIDSLEVKEVDLEKKEIIDKACWWLNNNRLGVIDDDYIKEFRKAINN